MLATSSKWSGVSAESRLDECEPRQLAVVNIPNVKTFTQTFFSNRHLCHKEAQVVIAKCSPVPHHHHHPPTSSLSLTYWWQSAQSLTHVHTIIWNLGDSKHSPYNHRPTTVCQPGKTNYHHLHSGLHTFTLHCSKKLLSLNVLLLLLFFLDFSLWHRPRPERTFMSSGNISLRYKKEEEEVCVGLL